MSDFDQFWAAYPRRIGKLDAIKAYAKARTVATGAEILAGVALYIRHKPEYADWCHPATWLNRGRWMDEYDVPVVKVQEDCPHTPECHNRSWCRTVTARERGEVA
jgi:hypothetical protein